MSIYVSFIFLRKKFIPNEQINRFKPQTSLRLSLVWRWNPNEKTGC